MKKDCFLGGMSTILEDTKELVNQELPKYVLCAVAFSLIVLFLFLENTAVPFIFMLGIIFPVVYNFGSNVFMGEISYITQALAAVLQLGVTMDFSIFLLHRYQEEKVNKSNEDAMVSAICLTSTSILSSSLTTIAWLLGNVHDVVDVGRRYRYRDGEGCCARRNQYPDHSAGAHYVL